MNCKTFFTAAVVGFVTAPVASAAVIDLGFVLDESGSIGLENYEITRDALADALSGIPTSGDDQFRVAVTSFSNSVDVVVTPTIVTAASLPGIQELVRASQYDQQGITRTDLAITQTFDLYENLDGGIGDTTLINVTTDGEPFNGSDLEESQLDAEAAALQTFNDGLDGLSFEAVGAGVNNDTNLEKLRRLAGLGTAGDQANGLVVNDTANIPDPSETGFVLPTSDIADYEATIASKIDSVVGSQQPSPVPVPAGLPLLLTGIGALVIARRKRKAA